MAIFHQLLFDAWADGEQRRPLVRIKIDEKNCFGMLEWPAIRASACQTLPRHYPVLCLKHGAVSYAEQEGIEGAPKDRGAEQGDVDGPLECAIALATVAVKVRAAIHRGQLLGQLPWASDNAGHVDEANKKLHRKGGERSGLGQGAAGTQARRHEECSDHP